MQGEAVASTSSGVTVDTLRVLPSEDLVLPSHVSPYNARRQSLYHWSFSKQKHLPPLQLFFPRLVLPVLNACLEICLLIR